MKARGFTLIELMVTTAIFVLVIGVAGAAFLGQTRTLQSSDMVRVENAASRDATLELERTLRRAGYGVPPWYAFDFRGYNCTSANAGLCRDTAGVAGAPITNDELVFMARNPNYACPSNACNVGNAWQITAIPTPNEIDVNYHAGALPWFPGQVVLATCAAGANPVMATVSTTQVSGTTLKVNLTTGSASTLANGLASTPYQNNTSTTFQGCHSSGFLFLVDRYRYTIRTLNGAPWLVLDRGLDTNGDGKTAEFDADPSEYIPVAKNVEDLQVAYVMNRGSGSGPDLGDHDWVVANVAGTQEEPNPTLSAPDYSKGFTDPTRYTLHPANIRAVRVTLQIRSDRTNPNLGAGQTGDVMAFSENRNAGLPAGADGSDRRRRITLSSTVTVRNLTSSAPFLF